MTIEKKSVTPLAPPSGASGTRQPGDRLEVNMNEMTQHVHQHQGQPRDLDYRAQAFAFALSVASAQNRHDYTSTDMIGIASKIEGYLRDGLDK